VATFANASLAHFSLDGSSLAISAGDRLDIYDFPLPRPWFQIVAYGSLMALGVWLCGCLLAAKAASKR
jgi:hypothetical protein